MNFSAIILSAGSGLRYGKKKQDELLFGVQLWQNVLNTTLKVIPREKIVVVGKDVTGGNTRTESVRIGMKNIDPETERVIILEAARPLVTDNQIIQLLNDKHPSSTFVKQLVNTVIYKNGEYINRNDLYELLTPQAFDYKLLMKAFETSEVTNVTDETIVMFKTYSIKPHFIETGNNLFKVTYPGDLKIIESICRG